MNKRTLAVCIAAGSLGLGATAAVLSDEAGKALSGLGNVAQGIAVTVLMSSTN
jgi:hypothetical protein